MWDNTTITMLLEGTRDTLYMTLVSTFFGYVLGLPLGILLAVTDKEGIHPKPRPNAPNRILSRGGISSRSCLWCR